MHFIFLSLTAASSCLLEVWEQWYSDTLLWATHLLNAPYKGIQAGSCCRKGCMQAPQRPGSLHLLGWFGSALLNPTNTTPAPKAAEDKHYSALSNLTENAISISTSQSVTQYGSQDYQDYLTPSCSWHLWISFPIQHGDGTSFASHHSLEFANCKGLTKKSKREQKNMKCILSSCHCTKGGWVCQFIFVEYFEFEPWYTNMKDIFVKFLSVLQNTCFVFSSVISGRGLQAAMDCRQLYGEEHTTHITCAAQLHVDLSFCIECQLEK